MIDKTKIFLVSRIIFPRTEVRTLNWNKNSINTTGRSQEAPFLESCSEIKLPILEELLDSIDTVIEVQFWEKKVSQC